MNRNIKSILLLSASFLTACGNASNPSDTENKDTLDYNISTFSKGFLMDGSVTQTRAVATGQDSSGNYIFSSTQESNTYNTQIGFENRGRNGIYKYSTQEYDGEIYGIENYTYFEDEDGYAYKESLNCKNELVRNYTINQAHPSFAYNGFYNPFSILNKSDFTQSDEGVDRYDLDTNKAGIISNNLLYSLNSGFSTSVKEAYFTVADNLFSEFVIVMNSYLYVDSSYGYLYKVENTAEFSLLQAGTYTISSSKVHEDKGYTSLAKGLKEIGDNFTMHVVKNALNQMSGGQSISYEDFYFTGERIYVHSYTDESKADPNYSTDYYLAPDASGLLYSYVYDTKAKAFVKKSAATYPSLYQGKFTYEDYLPNVSEVSSNLFTYNETYNYYEADEDAVSTLTSCFYLQAAPYKRNAAANFIDVQIDLIDDSIAMVTLPYSYTDFSSATIVTGTYEISYSDIGETEIPEL